MTPTDRSKWRFKKHDQLETQTLLEWGVASVPSHHVVMRVGYAISRQEWDEYQKTDRAPHQIQAVMSPTAAKELAAQLVLYAEWAELATDTTPNAG
ncbi:hypothetical protein [Rhizobium herbae]|uniref:F0F1-type ATP synthase epsilon subunit n=1 Tax=Rhizobium herbae TaxID=508661 RepID=A0ABS4EWH4_9HYPH|nr:hypothetical protein [Rhizobium herbae]MBP1862282.1 F0F1-type ATP synthase epsilon subunit [Rhizobium herbae]